MAIIKNGTTTGGLSGSLYEYDPRRDVYFSQQSQEYMARMQMENERLLHLQQGLYPAQEQKQKAVDPKDPLAFLNKTDKTVLLTGEA